MLNSTSYKHDTCLDIINPSNRFEENIGAVWQRNVFFILWYGLMYLYFLIFASCNRIKRGIFWFYNRVIKKRSYTHTRKVSKNNLIEMHNIIIDSNIFITGWYMILFLSLGTAKLIYHLALITWWIIRKILIPIILYITGVLLLLALLGNNNTNNNNN